MGNIEPLVLEIFALAANIATICGVCVATVGVLVAIVGGGFAYNSWKREIRGSAKFDLAQELLMSVYILRNAVADFRIPWKPTPETMESLLEKNPSFEEDSKNPWLFRVPSPMDEIEDLEAKWSQIAQVAAQVDTLKSRAEVLLHPEVVKILENISIYVGGLYLKSSMYKQTLLKVADLPFKKLPPDLAPAMWNQYHELFYQPDFHGFDLIDLIEKIEYQVKRYLED